MAWQYSVIASQILRALRGRRSQRGFSKRIGYRSNIAYRWEAGRCFPSAAESLALIAQSGVDLPMMLRRFLRADPAWLASTPVATPAGVAMLLEELRGKTPVAELARRSAFNRYALARWFKGNAEPRLPEFLELVELTSYRMLDFVALLVEPGRVPSIAKPWVRLEATREAAYTHPWSHAILRALELEAYAALGRHQPGWLARRLRMPPAEERRCLQLLRAAGQIQRREGLWRVTEAGVVDTRPDRERGRALKAFWMRTAVERFESGAEGVFGYNLMALSSADLPKLRELHIAYFQAMRTLVAESKPSEHVVLFCAQLFPLDSGVADGER